MDGQEEKQMGMRIKNRGLSLLLAVIVALALSATMPTPAHADEFGINLSPGGDVYVAIPEDQVSPFRVATFAVFNNGDREWHALWLDVPQSEYFYLMVDGQESVPCVVGNLPIGETRAFELWATGVPPEYDIYASLKSSDGYPLAPVVIHFVEGEARYGGVNYARFGDAYNATNIAGEADSESTQTITLLKDVTHGDPIVAYGYDLSIDLSGHDLNVDCDTNDAVIAALGGGSISYMGAGEFNVTDTYHTYEHEDSAGENKPILVKGGGSVEVTNVSGGAITVSDPHSSLTVHGDITVNEEMVPNEVTDIMLGEVAEMTVDGGIYGGRIITLYDSPLNVGGDVEGRIEAHGQTDVTIGGDVTGTEAGGVLYDYGSRGLVTIEGSLTVPDGAPYIVMNGSQHGDFVTVPKGPDDYDSIDEDGYKIYSETWQSGTSSIVRIHNVETPDDPPDDDPDPPDEDATLEYIELVTPPDKTAYMVGERLDITGLSVNEVWSDGRKVWTDLAARILPGYSYSPAVGAVLTASDTTVWVSRLVHGGGYSRVSFPITVTAPPTGGNHPPVVIPGQANQTGTARPASADGSVEATVYNGNLRDWFADPDGDALSYQVISVTPQAAGDIGVSASAGSLAYAPGAGVAGKAVTIVVKANDGEYDSTDNVTLTVSVGTVPAGSRGGGEQISDSDTPLAQVSRVRAAQTSFVVAKNGKLTIPYELDMASGETKNAKLTWTSSKPSVATVKDGKVTAKKSGTVTITVTDEAGNVVGKFNVKVVAKAVKLTKLTAKAKKSTLKVGQSTMVAVKLTPKGATGVVAKFSLDSKSKRIVSVDKAGKIIAKKKGTAKITVKAGGKSAKVKIAVK
jgi:hypothetical protein